MKRAVNTLEARHGHPVDPQGGHGSQGEILWLHGLDMGLCGPLLGTVEKNTLGMPHFIPGDRAQPGIVFVTLEAGVRVCAPGSMGCSRWPCPHPRGKVHIWHFYGEELEAGCKIPTATFRVAESRPQVWAARVEALGPGALIAERRGWDRVHLCDALGPQVSLCQ